jgi:hypothetical protein
MARRRTDDIIMPNPIHLANRLGEQYIVDQWAKVESQRLRYLECNQKKIRAELYSSYSDAVRAGDDSNVNLGQIGKPTILPSSFTGSERYMCEKYQDAMAICRRYGRPHLFVTMTCNPDWAEIRYQLKQGQNAVNRPDICCRVFKLKHQELMKDITQRHVFGRVVANVHSIEFQKRGFPHAHILIWFKDKHHLTVQTIDHIISAEIPDQYLRDTNDINPVYNMVTKSMIHGPNCTKRNLGCSYNGVCKYHYPQKYESQTIIEEDNYARYRRRSPEEGGNQYIKYINNMKHIITNADVVPYSPWLIKKYDCHINVEYVHSVKSIKYVFKYIMKGSDQAIVTIEKEKKTNQSNTATVQANRKPRDEIKEYETKRYVSSVEACWRLFGFDMTGLYPKVEALPVHVPGAQTIYFDPDSTDIAIAEAKLENNARTKLTEYFRMCQDKIGGAENLFYYDMPEHFKWDMRTKTWQIRKYDRYAVGRMHQAHPSNVERFHLRLLLNKTKGATSFEHLKTIDNGNVCKTFLDACIAKHLTRDDQLWYDSMTEAVATMTNMHQLRDYFACIILLAHVGNPLQLYERFKDSMRDDFTRKYEMALKDQVVPQMQSENKELEFLWNIEMIALNASLCELEKRFNAVEKTTTDFGLPVPNVDRDEFYQAFVDNSRETSLIKERSRLFYEENINKLNQGQQVVYKTIEDKLNSNKGGLVFLDAPGGTGKTFMLNVIAAAVRRNDGKVASTAFSGIAATLLHEGRTPHNMFKIPIDAYYGSTCNVPTQSDLAKYMRDMDIGFIDEGPMMNKASFECLDRTLQELTGNHHEKFGGKLILVSGDFRQMLPVVIKGYRATVVSQCLKSSTTLWDNDVTILKLTQNMRVQKYINQYPDDSEFHSELRQFEKWLLLLGDGKASVSRDLDGIVQIPTQMARESREEVMDSIYAELNNKFGVKQYLASRLILAADNAIVNETNIDLVQRLRGELHTFKSIDTVDDDDHRLEYPVEFLNLLNPSGLAEHELYLKVGAPVILLRNFDVKAGHCNGTRYIIKEIRKYSLELEKLSASNHDVHGTLELPRIPMGYNPKDMPMSMQRLQFPIKLAFAVTFHRSQGQSVEHCGILLPRDVWTHGQIYVAFSRCGNPRNVHVWANQDEFKSMGLAPTAKWMMNVVYPEVLGSNNTS